MAIAQNPFMFIREVPLPYLISQRMRTTTLKQFAELIYYYFKTSPELYGRQGMHILAESNLETFFDIGDETNEE